MSKDPRTRDRRDKNDEEFIIKYLGIKPYIQYNIIIWFSAVNDTFCYLTGKQYTQAQTMGPDRRVITLQASCMNTSHIYIICVQLPISIRDSSILYYILM